MTRHKHDTKVFDASMPLCRKNKHGCPRKHSQKNAEKQNCLARKQREYIKAKAEAHLAEAKMQSHGHFSPDQKKLRHQKIGACMKLASTHSHYFQAQRGL